MFALPTIRRAAVVVVCAVALGIGALSGQAASAATGSLAAQHSATMTAPAACGHCGQSSWGLRDRCGGANANVAWNGSGGSSWGIVWTTRNSACGPGTHWVELLLNGAFVGAGTASAGAGVGFNIGPANTPDGQQVNTITILLCSSEINNGCNDSHTFFV